jgi:hypothetical protein
VKKYIFSIFAIATIAVSSLKADDLIARGTVAVANDPTNKIAFGTDTTQSLHMFMEFVRELDPRAIEQLYLQGHVIGIPNGSKVQILDFDSGEDAYKVRVIGSTKEVWLTKELVSAENVLSTKGATRK